MAQLEFCHIFPHKLVASDVVHEIAVHGRRAVCVLGAWRTDAMVLGLSDGVCPLSDFEDTGDNVLQIPRVYRSAITENVGIIHWVHRLNSISKSSPRTSKLTIA